jgi:glucose/mannose-6-phosphate isomerase
MLCWHHAIPEMNHNELVGWRTKNEDLAVVILRNEDDYFRTQKRMEVNKTVFEKYTPTIIQIYSKGNSQLEKSLYLIHLGDWISFFLGEKKGVDITEVDVITNLKNELAKI